MVWLVSGLGGCEGGCHFGRPIWVRTSADDDHHTDGTYTVRHGAPRGEGYLRKFTKTFKCQTYGTVRLTACPGGKSPRAPQGYPLPPFSPSSFHSPSEKAVPLEFINQLRAIEAPLHSCQGAFDRACTPPSQLWVKLRRGCHRGLVALVFVSVSQSLHHGSGRWTLCLDYLPCQLPKRRRCA